MAALLRGITQKENLEWVFLKTMTNFRYINKKSDFLTLMCQITNPFFSVSIVLYIEG